MGNEPQEEEGFLPPEPQTGGIEYKVCLIRFCTRVFWCALWYCGPLFHLHGTIIHIDSKTSFSRYASPMAADCCYGLRSFYILQLKLVNIPESRITHLVTQMKWRLAEGQGEALYEIGVEDCGRLAGLTRDEMAVCTKHWPGPIADRYCNDGHRHGARRTAFCIPNISLWLGLRMQTSLSRFRGWRGSYELTLRW